MANIINTFIIPEKGMIHFSAKNGGVHPQVDIYKGIVPLSSIDLNSLNDDLDVRHASEQSFKGKRPGKSVEQMRDTLENEPENFVLYNIGIQIVAEEAVRMEDGHYAFLKASIINGGHTAKVLQDKLDANEIDPSIVKVSLDIYVTKDKDLAYRISLGRNTQKAVQSISIVGSGGAFYDLANIFEKIGWKLQTSETDSLQEENIINTELLIQIITSLVPSEKSPLTTGFSEDRLPGNYRQITDNVTKVLYNYQDAFQRKTLFYKFSLDIAYSAWEFYSMWSNDEEIVDALRKVRSGIISGGLSKHIFLPLCHHLAENGAVTIKDGKWTLVVPDMRIQKTLWLPYIVERLNELSFNNDGSKRRGAKVSELLGDVQFQSRLGKKIQVSLS